MPRMSETLPSAGLWFKTSNGCLISDRRSLISEGVLPYDLVVTNGEEVTAEDIDTSAIEQGAGESPLGHAVVLGDRKVPAIAPVRIGHGVEHGDERAPDLSQAHEPTAAELGS